MGLSLVLAIVISSVQDGALVAIQPMAHWIAEYSYGIYLSHMIVFWLALDVMKLSNPWLKFLILVTGSAGVPVLLYRFIEKPLITAGVRIANLMRPPGRGVPITP